MFYRRFSIICSIFLLPQLFAQTCPDFPLIPYQYFSDLLTIPSQSNFSSPTLSLHVDENTLRQIVRKCNQTKNWRILSILCTTGITDMTNLFLNCPSMNENISNWDVSAVTDMTQMFLGAINFDQFLGAWDVKKVRSMRDIFSTRQPPPPPVPLTEFLSLKARSFLKPALRRTVDDWKESFGSAVQHLNDLF